MSDKLQGGVLAGATSVSLSTVLRKTADSTEQTGKVAANMTLSYIRQGGVRVAVTASDLASVNSGFSSGGVKEIDSVNMPGAYRVDWPDAAFATGADWVQFAVVVSGCFVYQERIPITSNVIQTGDAFGRLGAPAGASIATDIATIETHAASADTHAASADTKIGTPAVSVSADIAAVKGETDTILADVNTGAGAIFTRLGAPAGASLAADIAQVETHAASVDSKIGSPAGGSVSADIAAVKGVLPPALSGNGNIKADVLELNGDTVAAANIAKTTRAIARGTVNTGATTTSIPTSAFTPAGAALDQFKGRIVTFDADTATVALRGQSTDIGGSSNASTPTLTVSALSTAPASGDSFSVT